jgi:hypothetical protein
MKASTPAGYPADAQELLSVSHNLLQPSLTRAHIIGASASTSRTTSVSRSGCGRRA